MKFFSLLFRINCCHTLDFESKLSKLILANVSFELFSDWISCENFIVKQINLCIVAINEKVGGAN